MNSGRHKPDLWLAFYWRNLLHIVQPLEVLDDPLMRVSPPMKSSLGRRQQVEAPDLSESLILNTGQWQGVVDDLEVCHNVRGLTQAQALQSRSGFLGSVPCV